MEKRYQVFISSTFTDLQNARQEVSQALLQTDCFPAGMELFPAADDEQFNYIKSIIDQSDYYIVVSAGRYGSVDPSTGLSYTEMEFDYAVQKKLPIIVLLHEDLKSIPAGDTEPTDEGKAALAKFRDKIKTGRIVRVWKDPAQLGAAVVLGLQWAKTHRPAVGWARADRVAADEARIDRSVSTTMRQPELEFKL